MKIFENIKISFLVLAVLFGLGYSVSFVNAQTALVPTVTLTATPQNFSGYQGLSTNITLSWSSNADANCKGSPVPTGGGAIHLFPLDSNWPSLPSATVVGSAQFLFANSTLAADMPFSMTCSNLNGASTTADIVVKYTPLSDSVVITSPSAGDSWQIGSAQTISWTFPDIFSSDTTSVALIQLIGSDGKKYIIAQTAPNTGNYAWDGGVYVWSGVTLIKTTIPVGTYSLSVGVSGLHTGKVMPGNVSINLSSSGSKPSATQTLTITSPVVNSTWAIGSTQTILWSNTGIPSNAKGHIFLQMGPINNSVALSTRYLIADNVSNTGSYTWNSVGSVYAVDKTIHTSFHDQCTETSPAWSCYDKLTFLSPGSYSMGVWFEVNSVAGVVMTISSPSVPFNLGTAGSVSTPPATPPTPPNTPPAECIGSPTALGCNSTPPVLGCSNGNLFNTQTSLPCVNNIGNTNQNASVGSYDFGNVILKIGSKGDAVKELQKYLNDDLDLGLKIDGKLGPKTFAVIKQWQSDHGLTADGFVGPKTKAEMARRIPKNRKDI